MMVRSLRSMILLSALLLTAACPEDPEGNSKTDEETSQTGLQPLEGTLVGDDQAGITFSSAARSALAAEAVITEDALVGGMDWTVTTIDVETLEETTVCQAEIALAGTPYTGDCDDCDFAFEMSSTVEVVKGGDCALSTPLHYVETEDYVDPILSFHSELSYDGYTYTDVLSTWYSYQFAGTAYPGYQEFIAFYGPYAYYYSSGYADLTDNGDGTRTLRWSWEEYYADYEYHELFYTRYYGEYCGGDYRYGGRVDWQHAGARSTIGCDYDYTFDLWSVELEAGDRLLATVDTVASDTAFDPALLVFGPETCFAGEGDDDFDCTFPPPDFSCPSVEIDAAVAGTYQIVVQSLGTCRGAIGEYEIHFGTDDGADGADGAE